MDAITTILSQYSGAEIILIVLLVAVGIKFVSELYDYFHKKLESKYDDEEEQEDRYKEMTNEIRSLNNSVQELATEMTTTNKAFKEDLSEVKESLYSINQRLLETIRSSILDKHHKYVQAGQITDFSLQSIERQYEYYKGAGGNTFIDRLMEDVRKLPVVNSDDAIGEGGNPDGTRIKDIHSKSEVS